MTARFDLNRNLVEGMARFNIEETANTYLARHASPSAPAPRVSGEIAEAVARLAFTEMAALSTPLSASMLISALPGAKPEQRETIIHTVSEGY